MSRIALAFDKSVLRFLKNACISSGDRQASAISPAASRSMILPGSSSTNTQCAPNSFRKAHTFDADAPFNAASSAQFVPENRSEPLLLMSALTKRPRRVAWAGFDKSIKAKLSRYAATPATRMSNRSGTSSVEVIVIKAAPAFRADLPTSAAVECPRLALSEAFHRRNQPDSISSRRALPFRFAGEYAAPNFGDTRAA